MIEYQSKKITLKRGDLKTIRTRIEIAQNYYKQTWEARDRLHADMYRGAQYPEDDQAKWYQWGMSDKPTLNYLKRLVKLNVAALAAEPPVFRFRPKKVGSALPLPVREALAQLKEAYLPQLWLEAGIHDQLKFCLRDRFAYGRGVCAIDWKVETQDAYIEGQRQGVPGSVLYDNPSVQRVRPDRFLLDPEVDTLNWEQAAFVAWKMRWTLDRIRKWAKGDPRVNHAVAERLKGDTSIDERIVPEDAKRPGADSAEVKRATIFRYHDRQTGYVCYLPFEQDDPLMAIENPYEFEGYPFEMLWGTPALDRQDATGTVEELRDWQRLFNLKRGKEANMIRTARHFVAVPSTMSDEEIQALESSDDRIIIKIDPGAAQPPREVNTTGFPPELIQFEGPMRTDYTELSGVNANTRGLTDPGVGTATEAQLLSMQSQTGDRGEQAEWEGFNRRVCVKVTDLLEQFGDTERMVGVQQQDMTGFNTPLFDQNQNPLAQVEQGSRYTWIRFTPQQIRDEADAEVLTGSMGVRQEAVQTAQFIKAVEAITGLAIAAPALQQMGMNLPEVAKELFRRFGNTETDRFFQTPQAAAPPSQPAPPGVPNGASPDGSPMDLGSIVSGLAQTMQRAGSPTGGGLNG